MRPPPPRCHYSLAAELGEQRLALAVAQATQATAGSDLEPLHDLRRANLADARKSLEQSGHLHLAQDLVALGGLEHIGQVPAATLEALLELSPNATSGSSLLQRCGPLLLGKLGKGHEFLRGVGI